MESVFLVVVATIFELLCSVIILKGLMGKKEHVPIWQSCIYVFVMSAYILLVPSRWVNGSYFLVFLYVKCGYQKRWKESVTVTILCLVLVGIIELVSMIPVKYLSEGGWTSIDENNLLGSLCSLIICLVVVQAVPLWRVKIWCNRKEILYITMILFSMILVLTTIMDFHMTLELDAGDYVYITLSVVLLWILGLRLMKYRYEEQIRKKYFEAFRSVMDQMKRRQHKFRNQMDAIYSLHRLYGDYETLVEEQRKYLGKLVDYELPTDVLILESPIVIAHVYDKITEAQEAGLRVQMRLSCSLAKCGIEDIHLVEIIGTLLDNAIQDMQETGQKEYLYFEVTGKDGNLIRVGNPHIQLSVGTLQKMFEKGYSTKGENRGIGLYHVKKLAQKYGIDLVVENRIMEEQNYICFSVIIGKSTQ